MAYHAPRTWTTSEIVTAAMMNEDVRDNVTYLKGEADKHDDCTQQTQADFDPDHALGTVYQNTGGKIRLVTVSCSFSGTDVLEAFSENDATPAVQVDEVRGDADVEKASVHFAVPPGWYYEVDDGLDRCTILHWTEWDLL